MPAENNDHHAPYCEILREGNALLYCCKGMGTSAKASLVFAKKNNKTLLKTNLVIGTQHKRSN